jgi:DNA-binding HxlR family transcriptional regulator
VRRTRFDRAPCPIARTTDLVGDWWTPVLLRNACLGVRRFEDFQRTLGVPRAILAKRLERLVAEGLLVKHPYQERPVRHEYRLTEKGRAFFDVLAAMWRWGEDWLWPEGEPPVELVDRETGRRIRPVVVDEETGERIELRRLRAVPKRPADPAAG